MLALSTWSEVQNSRDQSLAEIYFTRSCTINYLMAWKGFPFSKGAPIFQKSGDLESPELYDTTKIDFGREEALAKHLLMVWSE